METVNIHDAKTHLSRLVDRVAKGETVIMEGSGGAAFTLGSAFLAVPLSAYMRRNGRRPGLMFAFALGAVGALVLLPADDAAPHLTALARAARLPVLMTIPMMFFLVPPIFVILVAPAACTMIRTLH